MKQSHLLIANPQHFHSHQCSILRKQGEKGGSPPRTPRHLHSSSHLLVYYLKLRALISSQRNKFPFLQSSSGFSQKETETRRQLN